MYNLVICRSEGSLGFDAALTTGQIPGENRLKNKVFSPVATCYAKKDDASNLFSTGELWRQVKHMALLKKVSHPFMEVGVFSFYP